MVIVVMGVVVKWLDFLGFGEEDGYWNRGILVCVVCDGVVLIFCNKLLVVIGGGDFVMEEVNFLMKYVLKVYLIYRRDMF